MKKDLSIDEILAGFKKKDRAYLARAITLVESSHKDHQILTQELLKKLLPFTGKAKRIGISGTPGVGKSSFIEVYGKLITSKNQSVAVLAVDPTSKMSGGSILGDKTRMQELSQDPLAFIRPSPSGETLGGVARKTRETLLLCEAFGFDYILVETVGVGQSETTVSEMVDFFMMLLQPGAGDDLQGIKRGILELVDFVVVTKDDGDAKTLIQKAKHDYQSALHILRHEDHPKVLSCSALQKSGFLEIDHAINDFFSSKKKLIEEKRKNQKLKWMEQMLQEALWNEFYQLVSSKKVEENKSLLLQNKRTVPEAVEELLSDLRSHFPKKL